MSVFTFFVCLLIIYSVSSDCPNDKSHLAPIRLKNDLLCGYDRTIRPVINHQNSTKVTIRMVLRNYRYDTYSSTFTIDVWLTMFWKDEHLQWNPDDYDSLKLIHLHSNDIWIPDISIFNRNDESENPAVVDQVTCIVASNGLVTCVPSSRQNSLCVADLTKYPFDVQNCTVRFGSWVHTGEEIDIRVLKTLLSFEHLVPNGEWDLLDTKTSKHPGKYKCCVNNTYPSLDYSFKIKRRGNALVASIILPAFTLIVLTLTSLWISPQKNERLMICCGNIICHFLFTEFISWMIPLHGIKVPLIITFGRDSLLLASFTLVFTVLLKNIIENNKDAPQWISSFVRFIVSSRLWQFTLINDYSIKDVASLKNEDDTTTIIKNSENSNNKDGKIFVTILDRLCFVCYFIFYLCVFIIAFT